MTLGYCPFCDARIGQQMLCDRCLKRFKGHPEEIRQVMEALTQIICYGGIIKNPTKRMMPKPKCSWCNDTGYFMETGKRCSHS